VKTRHQKLIVFTCSLLLLLGLFASSSHATEHPFHAQDNLCASFISFGHHNLSVDNTSLIIQCRLFSVDVYAETGQSVAATFHPVYSSRAPPAK